MTDPNPTTGPTSGLASGPPQGLAAALAAGPVVLDGGLSTFLESTGHDVSGALWSARLLRDDPAAVVAGHAAFAAAGAQVATTASYQASIPGLVAAGLSRAAAARLVASSVHLAREGAPHGWVAGSVGPYGACRADGSEYTGAGLPGTRALRDFHRPRLELLAQAGADVLACETMPAAHEVDALLDELDALGVPAWVSLTTVTGPDGVPRTRTGERAVDVLRAAASVPCVIGVGVSCTDPAPVAATTATLRSKLSGELSGEPSGVARTALVAYPNSGEVWDAVTRTWHGDPFAGPDGGPRSDVAAWVAAGARLVGGCCRVGPDAVAGIAAAVDLATAQGTGSP